MPRRVFLGAAAALGLAGADEGWVELFDGRSLKGADFRNFELEIEAMTRPGANSGIKFHKGFRIQIGNAERNKTGSLVGLRHIYKQFVPDGQWFTIQAAVRGKNVQIRLSGMLLVDYTEPVPPLDAQVLSHGVFALENSGGARFRGVRVRRLPDDAPTPAGPPPVADEIYRQIIANARRDIPMEDTHVHLKGGLTLEQALAKSRRDGIQYGIACNLGVHNPVQDDRGALEYLEQLKGKPCYAAMQAEGREWTQMVSRGVAAQFDYIFTDSMTWTDKRGKRMRLWLPNEVGAIADPQEFMDTLVDRAVGILEHEPVDIYANPTFLPDVLAADYEQLWTSARRQKVIQAAVRNHVAIEINTRYKLPSVSFIRMAKAAGAKFTFGTNNESVKDLDRCEYGLRMVEECGLGAQDFFVPLSGPKAVERKGDALRSA